MITYIAFSKTSHKLYARILCRRFRHCAPVIKTKTGFILYQFVNRKNIVPIRLKSRDIKILEHNGWIFIKHKTSAARIHIKKSLTCVQFTKQVLGITGIFIQTPDQLFNFMHNKKTP